ncbi:hypothetical protein CA11_52960 [Gimesia maris]|nr:hypothetical protein CA11_52960 [Gimesia maris]
MNVTLKHLILCTACVLSSNLLCKSAEPSVSEETESQLKTAVSHLETAKENTKKQADIKSRVREVTWRLLAGEIASGQNPGMFSSAYDMMTKGAKELDQLLTDLETSPNLERELAANPEIAVRLDTAQVRRSEVSEKQQLSRSEELARLSQLRDINRAYRALLKHLIAVQTESLLGQPNVVAEQGKLALEQFQNVEKTVNQRRDYYLFEDEPSLEKPAEELKIINEFAAPYTNDALTHEQALLGLALVNLATTTGQSNREVLEAALIQADAAVNRMPNPDPIALYIRGLCRLELGRELTFAAPFKKTLHSQARDWFQKAQQDLSQAKASLSPDNQKSELTTKIEGYLQELEGIDRFQIQADQFIEQGNPDAAAAILFRGSTLHFSPALAVRWIDLHWRSGKSTFAELSKQASMAVQEGLVTENQIELLSLLGRVGILHAWSLISDNSEKDSFQIRRKQAQKILATGRSDLTNAMQISDITPKLKRELQAFYALSEAMLILLDTDQDPAQAKNILVEIPVFVRELQNDLTKADGLNRYQLLEAIQLAKIAEGYLTLRLLPDPAEKAQAAFATAMDTAARLPGGSQRLMPSGAATLRAILSREDHSDQRIAQEERQLRSTLQKIIPALASVSVGDPEIIAQTLSSSLTEVQQNKPAWDPQQQFDPRDIIGARDGVETDLRAVTVLSLIAAKQRESALHTMLKKWFPELKMSQLGQLDWSDVRKKYSDSNDPMSSYALGAALEEYAVTELNLDHQLHPILLKEALVCYKYSNELFESSILWRERWPFLKQLAVAGRDRLINENTALEHAIAFRASLHIQEARETLQDSLKRHPESILIREELIAILMDEAMLSPKNKTKILSQALEQIEQAKQTNGRLSAGSLAILGDLQEQFARWDAAAASYRKLAELTDDRSLKIKAESRLAIIMARTAESSP